MNWCKAASTRSRPLALSASVATLLLGALAAAGPAVADPYQEGYRKGFEDGYAAGQRAAQQNFNPGAAAAPPGGHATINRGIIVVGAVYGDGRRECQLTGRMAGMMNGRVSAKFEVTNALCGDPAPGQRKSLTIDYTCGGAEKRATAYEHRTIVLSCP